jgi:hemolysin activation/secretion protein
VAIIQVIEGSVETIEVSGTQRLNPGYVSSRLGLTVSPPLNVDRLLEGLQLLQLDPLIETISADLQAGTTPGTNRLVVAIKEADSFQMTAALDNNSPPSVGSVQRQIGFTEANLLGLGDGLTLQYINTDGSNEINASYTVPLSPRNATLSFSANLSESRVITPEFEILQISSSSKEFALSFQQPVVQTPTQNLTLGLILGYNTSQTRLGFDDIGPFPLSPGADSQGRTTVTSLSFSQSWTDRSTQQVFSAFSQFNLGVGLLGATVNEIGPDSQYFSWQGQAQWVRLLAADTLLLLRGSTQLASAPLLSQEQFGLGGQLTVRGYPQDVLLTDSGLQGTAEVRLPIMRVPELAGLLQVAPFLDAGYGWNVRGANPNPNTLIGIGAGLLWQQPNLFARLDWGIPLTTVSGSKSTLQENGLYFSLSYSFL